MSSTSLSFIFNTESRHEMFLSILLFFVIFVLLLTFLRGRYNENYWRKRGVTFYQKSKAGGPFWQFLIGNRSLFEVFGDVYKECENAPAVGLGSFFDQALFVKDPVNMLHVTQADFHSFNHRGIPIIDEDILANNIVFLGGAKWKLIRQQLTPLFTVAKLRNMYDVIDKSAQDFVEYLKSHPDKLKGNVNQTHETITRFCTAAISAAVFGIGSKSTFDSPIRKMITDAVAPTMSLNLKFAIGGISDTVYKALKLKLFGAHEEFFIGAIKDVIKQRQQDGVIGHDYADMCVRLQDRGTMHDPDTELSVEPTDEVLAAQAFFFFLAGIDPSGAAMFVTMMELGRHPDILKRAHEEVDEIFEKYNDQLTYDAICEVKYLDRVLSEGMRLYPPVGFLSRQCMKDTALPVGNVPVEKGVKIYMPIFDLHHDPKFYPNPEAFDPDRFLRQGEANDMTYLPFGQGKRRCIGERYARIQLISGLMHFLKHYTLKTDVHKCGIQYEKEPAQVRIKNVDVEFIPRY